jgi:CheY-like chemotaxis protein
MTRPIRVLVVDDDPLVRAGLGMILGRAPGIDVVGEAGDGAEAAAAVDAGAPDVVLMDIRMPRVDGLAATEQLRARPGAPEIIVLTTFDADEYVPCWPGRAASCSRTPRPRRSCGRWSGSRPAPGSARHWPSAVRPG